MRLKNKHGILKCSLCLAILFSASACKTGDGEIKGDVATKAKEDINFAGVKYIVQNGMVLLTGNCPSVESRTEVITKVKNIRVIKGIVNEINIAPVVLNNDPVLKNSVDSVLATYPTVQADVTQTDVILKGTAPKKDVEKVVTAIDKLDPGKVKNNIKAL